MKNGKPPWAERPADFQLTADYIVKKVNAGTDAAKWLKVGDELVAVREHEAGDFVVVKNIGNHALCTMMMKRPVWLGISNVVRDQQEDAEDTKTCVKEQRKAETDEAEDDDPMGPPPKVTYTAVEKRTDRACRYYMKKMREVWQ